MPGKVTYSRLLSAGPEATAAELLAEVRPRERAPPDRPFVWVNMVSPIDGRAQLRWRTDALIRFLEERRPARVILETGIKAFRLAMLARRASHRLRVRQRRLYGRWPWGIEG